MTSPFAPLIEQLQKRGLKNTEIAKLLGVSKPNINGLLKGLQMLDDQKIPLLAAELGIDAEELLARKHLFKACRDSGLPQSTFKRVLDQQ